jgi:hypothetical protein
LLQYEADSVYLFYGTLLVVGEFDHWGNIVWQYKYTYSFIIFIMLSQKSVIVGIDVGNVVSGVVAIVDGKISFVQIMDNKFVFETITGYNGKYASVGVVIEDIKPYAGTLSQQAIDTCKFIGQLNWRLDEVGIIHHMITRSKVRKFVYDSCFELIIPLVCRKIEKRNAKNNDGKNRKPSFVYVDDSMVKKAMRLLWKIPDAPPGKGYIHGLQDHTWQALGLISCFMNEAEAFSPSTPQISE